MLALGACGDDSGPGTSPDAGTEVDAGTQADAQRASALHAWTDEAAKTYWSNLPGVTRSGITWGTLSAESKTEALHLASLVLTAEGYADMSVIFAATATSANRAPLPAARPRAAGCSNARRA
ncbi:DUF3500 domain-containing protein [Corallococcus sp. EGB]|uniref:DUF3500 domain-containing protein n=1 Tax=Corallococcus sp. EGB TaxID=1521117 RepID=UPI001CBD2BDC|nr:DUF3500 domain-containing protein [Corallococcus sp. EGB]